MAHEPQGQLDNEAVTLHEMMSSFIRAGFSRKEAFEMVKDTFVAMSVDNAASARQQANPNG